MGGRHKLAAQHRNFCIFSQLSGAISSHAQDVTFKFGKFSDIKVLFSVVSTNFLTGTCMSTVEKKQSKGFLPLMYIVAIYHDI